MIKLGFMQKALGDGDFVFRPKHYLLNSKKWDFVNIGHYYETARHRFMEDLRVQGVLFPEADPLFTLRKPHYEINDRRRFSFGTPDTQPVLSPEDKRLRECCFPPALPGDELITNVVTYASRTAFHSPNIGIILD